MSLLRRREFLAASSAAAALGAVSWPAPATGALKSPGPAFGLVTYMWGADWDLPTLLTNCVKADVKGVELRTTHAHKVERDLTEKQRAEVRARFAESGVTVVGIGSAEQFDHKDPAALKKAIAATKEFLRLSHDVGGSGVKVRPNNLHKDVPHEKTLTQIGESLNELGEYAVGFGQQVRLEVHGHCAELPLIKQIMDVAKHPNVGVCWNSNPQDLEGKGLEHNFRIVRNRFGDTVHVHELNDPKYPYAQLFKYLVKSKYEGWVLLEAGSKPADRVAALAEQKKLFDQLVAAAS